MRKRSSSNNAFGVSAAAVLSVALFAQGQPPTLAGVLEQAAAYVAEFERQLTAMSAVETYEQRMGIPGRRGEFIATTRRSLTARFVLFRDRDQGYLERRDVIEVDGVPAGGGTAESAAVMPDASRWSETQRNQLRDDNARYNIGDIVRTINTPLLGLQVLRRANQSRFRFSVAADRSANVATVSDAVPGVFRVSTDIWVVAFQEQGRGTLIRTRDGKDMPAKGRVWINAGSGRVMMTEMRADNRQVEAEVTVSFKSQPLLGLLPPIEMHERYRARGRSQTMIEASARYGPFRLVPF